MTPPLTIEEGGQSFPHWAAMTETVWPLFEDFPTFLTVVWERLGLPTPTPRQLAIARRLQNPHLGAEGGASDVLRAFRGVGKSYITAAFALWRLMRNPTDEKVLVVSATTSKAKAFVAMVRGLMNTMDVLTFLRPDDGQVNQTDRFDVHGASLGQNPSMKAAGITGQITGSRATLIIADDIEIAQNARTEEARGRLLSYTAEFEAIGVPGFDMLYLGTPQTYESIYNRLVKERGYGSYCVPARYPTPEKRPAYVIRTDDGEEVDILAPDLIAAFNAGTLMPGDPTDPERFDEATLAAREARGRSFFALQYQLDTSLSDAERYPLRQRDLVTFECSPLKAPRTLSWGRDNDGKNVVTDISNVGFSGDILIRPLFVDTDWRDYEGKVLFVDPSGRGTDETAWWVVAHLNGLLYGLHQGSLSGDPAEAMRRIAADAKRFSVNVVEVEPNYGQGMWVTAFQPILTKLWPGGCTVQESEWAKGQKEARIIDTLEPVMTQHRLILSESVLRLDSQTADLNYSLLYQLTHITRDRGALRHDDRLDALAGAVAYWQRVLGMDAETASVEQAKQEKADYLRRFLGDATSPHLLRGLLRGGHRGETLVVSMGAAAGEGVLVYHGDDEDQPETPQRGYGAVWGD